MRCADFVFGSPDIFAEQVVQFRSPHFALELRGNHHLAQEGIRFKQDALIEDNIINADNLLVATGGMSYPATGSTGAGYGFGTTLNL